MSQNTTSEASVEELDQPVSAEETNVKVPSKSFNLFHPTMNGNGAALSMNAVAPHFDKDDRFVNGTVFVTFVPQNAGTKIGDKNLFNKDKSARVTMKLTPTDVGALLNVCYNGGEVGNTDKGGKFWSGLTHKTPNRTATMAFKKTDVGSYQIGISIQGGNKAGLTVFAGGEAVRLESWLSRSLSKIEPV